MGDFQRDTAVEGEAGRYRAALSRDWEIWGPNGGYLAAIALRAAGREAEIERPVAFSGHFLRVARFAPVELAVERVHRSRRAESLRVSMRQEGKPVLEALVRTALEVPGLVHDAADAPRVEAPEKLRPIEELLPEDAPRHPFWQNLESRPLRPERVGQPTRRPGPPVWREWYRFRPRAVMDDVFADAGRLLLLVDTLSWPAAVQPHPDHPLIVDVDQLNIPPVTLEGRANHVDHLGHLLLEPGSGGPRGISCLWHDRLPCSGTPVPRVPSIIGRPADRGKDYATGHGQRAGGPGTPRLSAAPGWEVRNFLLIPGGERN